MVQNYKEKQGFKYCFRPKFFKHATPFLFTIFQSFSADAICQISVSDVHRKGVCPLKNIVYPFKSDI